MNDGSYSKDTPDAPPGPESDPVRPTLAKRGTVIDALLANKLDLDHDNQEAGTNSLVNHGDEVLKPLDHVFIMIGVLVPAFVVLLLFTNVFDMGLKTYAALLKMNNIGNVLVMLGLFIFFIAYLCDYKEWKPSLKNPMLVLVTYMCLFGSLLKVKSYPEAPYIIVLFHVPILLGIVRHTCTKKAYRRHLYNAIAFWCGLFSVVVMIIFILYVTGGNDWGDEKKRMIKDGGDMYKAVDYHPYEDHCASNAPQVDSEGTELDEDALTARTTACQKVAGCQYLCWVGPLIVSMALLLMGTLCRLRAKFLYHSPEGTSKAEAAMKATIGLFSVLLLTLWVCASVAGADMGLAGTLVGFVGGFTIATFAWIYAELGEENILQQAAQSKLVQQCLGIARSDWARALFILCFNIMIPLAFPVNILNQRVRRCRGTTEHKGLFTENFTTRWEEIKKWNWTSILCKVHLLAILYFVLMVGVAKITYIFLSWLNIQLQSVDFGLVMIIFFGIGFMMFMLPPVPGVPVYITGGIILASRAASTSIGFWGGMGIAILLGYTLKLTAVAGQWSIGASLGKSVSIQKMVGVDQVGIRAIEDILRQPGLSLPKVAVLVGGPDWPTSVLCGILRIKVGQAVLGTMPCILVATPCVLVGAFLLKAGDESAGGSWGAIAGATLMVASLGQGGAGLMAAYFMSQVVSAKGEELAKPRPEHKPIEDLTKAEQAAVDAYKEVTQWQSVPGWVRWTLLISTFLQVMSWALLVFQDKTCFRPFSLTSRVGDPYDKNGLNGKVINIVLPMGWLALGMFTAACLGYKIVTSWAGGATKRKLASKPPQVEPAEDTDDPAAADRARMDTE